MPGLLLHVGAAAVCQHGGQALPTVSNPRVLVMGRPTVTTAASYVIAGCPLLPPPSGNGPCITAQWVTAAERVTSNGQPLLLADSAAVCLPTGTPLIVGASQTRVTGV